ncbi:hypothetical protein HN858_02010 [Candidatus Falkowbacteria bacterium]|mgnify:FL=1|jgi:hypothetical protein|nr:hypothetical protein [Candidatus Falkowbacteria bacterium]MBT5503585.1 hypothetical protein [Candidatus Falkowbacteria bacterium]MBT6573622.1 hypothetical protein [Candidatus Falkowbacteria bacterium]MBT7348430.1 hypothetical protein [Candidatus Falkowbacteria bacterium]MBT7500616.1 hypothetical protein [Candidatus Falkowbacteria bacterium]
MIFEQFKNSKLIAECPVCKKKQFPATIKMIEETDQGQMLHIECKSCHGAVVVLLSTSEQGINLVGVLTELNSEEIIKFIHRGPLVSDDLLDFYKKLQAKQLIK